MISKSSIVLIVVIPGGSRTSFVSIPVSTHLQFLCPPASLGRIEIMGSGVFVDGLFLSFVGPRGASACLVPFRIQLRGRRCLSGRFARNLLRGDDDRHSKVSLLVDDGVLLYMFVFAFPSLKLRKPLQ